MLVAAHASLAGVADNTYYKTLNVPVDASHTEISKAYRALALRWHPDKNPQDREHAQAQFVKLANAYLVLSTVFLPLCLSVSHVVFCLSASLPFSGALISKSVWGLCIVRLRYEVLSNAALRRVYDVNGLGRSRALLLSLNITLPTPR